MDSRFTLKSWAIGAEISSGEHRLPGYVSLRSEAAAGTHTVQSRMRHACDAPS
jgi:hypothetical protein